jgi:hypothetical protein
MYGLCTGSVGVGCGRLGLVRRAMRGNNTRFFPPRYYDPMCESSHITSNNLYRYFMGYFSYIKIQHSKACMLVVGFVRTNLERDIQGQGLMALAMPVNVSCVFGR